MPPSLLLAGAELSVGPATMPKALLPGFTLPIDELFADLS
jgi:hypothetical protein